MIEKFLEGNRAFVTGEFADKKAFYAGLAKGQNPKVLWIGCSDSRVTPERITSAEAGELFVHRNIGNIVPLSSWSFATVLEYALRHLKVEEIAVCGHSDCGAMKALGKETEDVYIPLWLNNAGEVLMRVDAEIRRLPHPPDERGRRRMVELENVRLQIAHLRTYPLVRRAEAEGKIRVHGLYFDLDSGRVTRVP
ncbi:MAG: carbonic anhydrase [Methanomicrobiales archaeon]|jgi:carbonic anhydrase